jgi:putative lipoic acid-binding regulatory protein
MKRIPDDARPSITYPTQWTYTVIGKDRSELERAVADVVGKRTHKLSLSKISSKGRYMSMTLELMVVTESERLRIFESLRKHPAVKLVL